MENFGQKKKNGPVNIRANEIVSVIVEKFLILCLSLFFSVTPGKSVVFVFFSRSTSAVESPKTIYANWSWSDLEGRATSDQLSLLPRVLFDLCQRCLLLNRNILKAFWASARKVCNLGDMFNPTKLHSNESLGSGLGYMIMHCNAACVWETVCTYRPAFN